MNFWQILDIAPTADKRQIKKAYANQLQQCHPETNPTGFQQLREAYEQALDYANHPEYYDDAEEELIANNDLIDSDDIQISLNDDLTDIDDDDHSPQIANLIKQAETLFQIKQQNNLNHWQHIINNLQTESFAVKNDFVFEFIFLNCQSKIY